MISLLTILTFFPLYLNFPYKLPLYKVVEAYRESSELNTLPNEIFYKWAGIKIKNGDVVEDKGYITDWLKRNGMVVYNPIEICNIFKYGLLKIWEKYLNT